MVGTVVVDEGCLEETVNMNMINTQGEWFGLALTTEEKESKGKNSLEAQQVGSQG
jgi:hypothetical protein